MPSALAQRIEYSEKYSDDSHEYRHVILPKELAKSLPRNRLLSENEWRHMGVQQEHAGAGLLIVEGLEHADVAGDEEVAPHPLGQKAGVAAPRGRGGCLRSQQLPAEQVFFV